MSADVSFPVVAAPGAPATAAAVSDDTCTPLGRAAPMPSFRERVPHSVKYYAPGSFLQNLCSSEAEISHVPASEEKRR